MKNANKQQKQNKPAQIEETLMKQKRVFEVKVTENKIEAEITIDEEPDLKKGFQTKQQKQKVYNDEPIEIFVNDDKNLKKGFERNNYKGFDQQKKDNVKKGFEPPKEPPKKLEFQHSDNPTNNESFWRSAAKSKYNNKYQSFTAIPTKMNNMKQEEIERVCDETNAKHVYIDEEFVLLKGENILDVCKHKKWVCWVL